MVIIEGWVRFAAGEIDRLREDAAKMLIATRQEAGCLSYAYSVDLVEPTLMRVVERWETEAAVAAHMASPHMKSFNQMLGSAKIEGLSIRAYSGEYVRTLMGS